MLRILISSLLLLLSGSVLSAQEATEPLESPQDSAPASRMDTMYVIPAGPVAGLFTVDSRLQVVDTVAGWARIQVEGWVPLAKVQDRIESVNSYNTSTYNAPLVERKAKQRCSAITQKGSRCKRSAAAGSDKCWQHQ